MCKQNKIYYDSEVKISHVLEWVRNADKLTLELNKIDAEKYLQTQITEHACMFYLISKN